MIYKSEEIEGTRAGDATAAPRRDDLDHRGRIHTTTDHFMAAIYINFTRETKKQILTHEIFIPRRKWKVNFVKFFKCISIFIIMFII